MTWLLGQSGNTTNYIQLIVWTVLILFTVISGLLRVIATKRAESKVSSTKRQREEDMLRTGRTEGGGPVVMSSSPVAAATPTSHEDARRRLQEVAQRRRAELEQMRQRGEQVGGRKGRGPAGAAARSTADVPDDRPDSAAIGRARGRGTISDIGRAETAAPVSGHRRSTHQARTPP